MHRVQSQEYPFGLSFKPKNDSVSHYPEALSSAQGVACRPVLRAKAVVDW